MKYFQRFQVEQMLIFMRRFCTFKMAKKFARQTATTFINVLLVNVINFKSCNAERFGRGEKLTPRGEARRGAARCGVLCPDPEGSIRLQWILF